MHGDVWNKPQYYVVKHFEKKKDERISPPGRPRVVKLIMVLMKDNVPLMHSLIFFSYLLAVGKYADKKKI